MNTSTLRFFWNGIKGSDGKLQRCHYSDGELLNHPAGTITIYARTYDSFSAEVRAAFPVANDSDPMTDYFEKDRARVAPDNPLYASVVAAMRKAKEHADARWSSYLARKAAAESGEWNLVLGKRGAVTFDSQSNAEDYLIKLPVNYVGATHTTEFGKWMVSYRRIR